MRRLADTDPPPVDAREWCVYRIRLTAIDGRGRIVGRREFVFKQYMHVPRNATQAAAIRLGHELPVFWDQIKTASALYRFPHDDRLVALVLQMEDAQRVLGYEVGIEPIDQGDA